MIDQWDAFWHRRGQKTGVKKSWSKIRIEKLLGRFVNKGDSVLDAGCGSGFFCKYFLAKDCRVTALDYSRKALECTKELTEGRCERYLEKDLTDSHAAGEFKSEFDVIFSDGLFEHFPETVQRKIISNFMKMKKDSGLIITFVPNFFSSWTLVRPFFMPGMKEKPFTMPELRRLHSGLHVIKDGGINIMPVKYSPDKVLGRYFGMLLYIVGR